MSTQPPAPDDAPLAARMRPASLTAFVGQTHLLGPGKPLRQAVARGRLHSMLLWGPPGTGKTTLARLLAAAVGTDWLSLSAVLGGVKDVRAAVATAEQGRAAGRETVLFIDEVHRFNKAQQDAFLPHVEKGTIILIGATTENPSFEVIGALLSRTRIYVLKRLDDDDLATIAERALRDPLGLGERRLSIDAAALTLLTELADGDARRCLNLLDVAAQFVDDGAKLDEQAVGAAAGARYRRFDKGGDAFYDQISALHKAVRGSAPDAALYWFVRMLDGGCDPLYVARRLVRMASEDIGNADPRALALAVDAWQTFERLGAPEGELALAQAVLYLAVAPKSNAVNKAYAAARTHVAETGSLEVPERLRNAPTALARRLGHGQGYRYAHDEAGGYAAGERYFPPELADTRYYEPVDRGLESKIKAKLATLRALDEKASRE